MHKTRGNILFLILLAVVLFAALSYAVTSSMRGGGKDASTENVQASVSDISNFFIGLESATQRIMLTGGIAPENISFEYPRKQYDENYGGSYGNSNCTSDNCRIFKPSGGGMEARTFEKYALTNPAGYTSTSTKPGHYDFIVMQYPYAGTSANDIVLSLRAIKPEICAEFNKRMGIINAPTTSGSTVAAHVTANWDNAGLTVNNSSELVGKNSFAQAVANGYCNIYQLLIAR